MTIYRNSKESVIRKKRSENGLIQQLSVIWRITFGSNIKQEAVVLNAERDFFAFPFQSLMVRFISREEVVFCLA